MASLTQGLLAINLLAIKAKNGASERWGFYLWTYMGLGALITPINYYTQQRVREWAETHGEEYTRKHICRMSDKELKELEDKIDDKKFP